MINFGTDFEIVIIMKKFFLLFTMFFTLLFYAEDVHPYHVGSVEINYNSKTKTFEISAKFFLDDLENALNKKYNKTLHFGEEKSKAGFDEVIHQYFDEYFKLKNNNKFLKVNYIGYGASGTRRASARFASATVYSGSAGAWRELPVRFARRASSSCRCALSSSITSHRSIVAGDA